MTFPERVIVLQPGEGKTVSVLGDSYTYKAVGEQTAGAYGLVEVTVPTPSAGPPPHIHRGEDEAFYVLDGEITVQVGDRTLTAGAGAFVFVPCGTVHTFSNQAPRVARLLVIISPPGFERAFAEMAEVAASTDLPPEQARFAVRRGIAEKYNMQIADAPPA